MFPEGCLLSYIVLLGQLTLAMPGDFYFSIYGKEARQLFDKLPNNGTCAYAQTKEEGGELAPGLKLVIKKQKINSVTCKTIGENTTACEARTDISSDNCGLTQ